MDFINGEKTEWTINPKQFVQIMAREGNKGVHMILMRRGGARKNLFKVDGYDFFGWGGKLLYAFHGYQNKNWFNFMILF